MKNYHDLTTDYHQMYDMHVTILPVVLELVSLACMGHIKEIPNFSSNLFSAPQKVANIGTVSTLSTIPFT